MRTFLLLFLSLFVISYGQLVSNTLGSNMVLQRSPERANVYGFTKSGSTVTVTFNSQNLSTKAGTDGAWLIQLPPTNAGGPYDISVSSSNGDKTTLTNVLFGDVWICGGQSNMAFTVDQAFNNTNEVLAANNYPFIRVFSVGASTISGNELPELKGIQLGWSVADAKTIGGGNWTYMSAVCWFFGRGLYDQYKVPIGLISSNWGGTIIQAWGSKTVNEQCNVTIPPFNPNGGPNQPTVLYNSMIYPFLKSVITGAIWYQGESNVGAAEQYKCLEPAMISDWRANFYQQTKFTFLFVQLAPWISTSSVPVADLRAAQLSALSLPNVGFATAIDLGDPVSPFDPIHPRNKQEVGRRLVLAARNITYGEKNVVWMGPIFYSSAILMNSNTVYVNFTTQGEKGLITKTAVCPSQVPSASCANWEIQLSDGNWYAAKAVQTSVINQVEVNLNTPKSNLSVRGIRYGYAIWPLITLYSAEGLPAIPFQHFF